MADSIWLSREGKTQGPFDSAQVEAMKAAGEIKNYMYIWRNPAEGWTALHALPPPPPATTSVPERPSAATLDGTATGIIQPQQVNPQPERRANPRPEPQHPAPSQKPQVQQPEATHTLKPMSAVCYNDVHVMGGVIQSRIGEFWVMESSDFLENLPPFRKQGKVHIHLLDESTGKTEMANAEIVDYKKAENSWEYRLKWQSNPPQLFK